MKIKIYLLIFSIFLLSCQPNKVLHDIKFDYNSLSKININANQVTIDNIYNSIYEEPYIENSLKFPPSFRINSWLDKNISVFGTRNTLIINILDASITREEKENDTNKKYEQKIIYYYEIFLSLEFILLDDLNSVLATTNVEAKRSTTSSKFISLNEKENILDKLTLEALIDLSNKTDDLLNLHMSDYIL